MNTNCYIFKGSFVKLSYLRVYCPLVDQVRMSRKLNGQNEKG